MSPIQVYTVREAATIAKCGVAAIRKLIRTGVLRYQRIGRRFVVPASDLAEYLDRNWRREGRAA
ncbi:MAG TPA: helix-turn-helix domain-containing protein [Candidatus Acidoferrales bacterium]|jgi:excisionase family DNA binding protein|nr:helix-turn-helix domain-containing protein [Candidatus Acidoferrales bacterium]